MSSGTRVARIVDLERDKRIRYVLIFKHHGDKAGAHTITHSISQLMALPVTPRVIKAKLMAAQDYYSRKERCIYCDVLHQELTERKRLVAENSDFVSLAPFASRSHSNWGCSQNFTAAPSAASVPHKSKTWHSSCVMSCKDWTKL